MQTRGGWSLFEYASGSRKEGGLVPKLVWRVKLVAELEPGVTTETEVACLERNEEAGLADLGLRLDEAKQLTAALQAEMVSAQVAVVGERRRGCAACERSLASKGHYRATFRSLFGDVPVRVRRLLVCPCHGPGEPKSFAALDLGPGPAPELAYVTAKFAALAPFGKVAALFRAAADQRGAERRHCPKQDVAGRPGRCAAAPHQECGAPRSAGGRPRRGWAGWRLRAQPAPAGAPLRSGRGQGDRRPGCAAPLRLRPQRPGDRIRSVQAGACRGPGAGGHARDGAVRRRCRAMAAAARGAAGCHDRAGLVARRCPLRARAAGGAGSRRRHG